MARRASAARLEWEHGTLRAFLRAASERTTTLVIPPANDGPERRFFTLPSESFTWGPENRLLIVSHQSDRSIWPNLHGYDMEKNESWEITPVAMEGRGDGAPALLPGGGAICFVRQESRESADLFLLPVDSTLHPTGTPRRLTSRRLRIGFPQWTPDGKEIVFGSGTLGNFRAFRVAADGRSEPHEVVEAKAGVASLAKSHGSVLKLRRFSREGDVDPYRTSAPPTWALSFSPDSRRLLCGQEDVVTSEVLLVNDFR